MELKNKFLRIAQSPWIISLCLFCVFLIVTGYKYGWDDQHLEIPLLKHLINPSLYVGDYYIESLKVNFSSYFYPLLSKLISVEQIPSTYFILYLASRYFLFFWIYKIWLLISQSKFKSVCCVLTFILMTRVNEFLYRTFSHQEFALAIIFAGIYFFFKERFILSAMLLGISANLHALYSLFPMLFMGAYLLVFVRKHGFKTLLAASATFALFCLPFIFWIIKNRFLPGNNEALEKHFDWLSLYISACPQNFFFPELPQIKFGYLISKIEIFFHFSQVYLLLIAFFILNLFFNETFRKNKQAVTFSSTAFLFLLVCLLFTYFYPNRFILDLNIVRNTQFLLWLFSGFTVILIINTIQNNGALTGLIFAVLFSFLKFNNKISFCALSIMFFTLAIQRLLSRKKGALTVLQVALFMIPIIYSAYTIFLSFKLTTYKMYICIFLSINFIILTIIYFLFSRTKDPKKVSTLKVLIIVTPLIIFFFQYSYYRYTRTKFEFNGHGFWRLQKSWEDMQLFVKDNTPIDATILVPYNMEMGGFRMFSDRKIVASYRDCGIVGFDYSAALEWQRRIRDIQDFKIFINKNPKDAINKAITKYGADYIVFMRHASPTRNTIFFQKIYTNEIFTLFKVHQKSLLNKHNQP